MEAIKTWIIPISLQVSAVIHGFSPKLHKAPTEQFLTRGKNSEFEKKRTGPTEK